MIHAWGLILAATLGGTPVDEAFFETKIRPVLSGVCVRCHGADKKSGGLRLDSRQAVMRGGNAGRIIDRDDPNESLIIQVMRREGDLKPMPPDHPVAKGVADDFARWIAADTPWPARMATIAPDQHWAFKPITAKPTSGPGHFIDRALDGRQKELGLKPVERTDKRTLIRRATFDLTGLPPTPEDVERFLADSSDNAFAKVIDRLLASPQYGAKWGRMWLDVARYADTAGETADLPAPDAWRYRNYVIDAFNADKPFDQFIREQIAGDLLANELPANAPAGKFAELVTATGYLAISRRFGFDINADHYLTIDDTIDTLGKSVLGLTLGCARCHNHKYDPVSTQDYYALYGIFDSTKYPFSGCEKDRVPKDQPVLMSKVDYDKGLAPLEAKLVAESKRFAQAEAAVKSADRGWENLASGEIANGGKGDGAATLDVKRGTMLRFVVLPKNGHGADSTFVSFRIEDTAANGRVWDVATDFLADPSEGGRGFQHTDAYQNRGVWSLWDAAGTPRLLTEFIRDAERTKGLMVWRGPEDTPSIFINVEPKPIKFITVSQPARSFGMHPGPRGGVALGWKSPIDAKIRIKLHVEDMDAGGGDGIGWTLSRGPDLSEALAGTIETSRALNAAKAARDAFIANIPRGYAVGEGQSHHVPVYIKGDPMTRGEIVPRRFLTVLGGQAVTDGSGRKQLANWLTDAKNPLTPRVIVNRVWQGHFGEGLVRSPDNFGIRGEPPNHPELLDELAARLIASGWSLKSIHRAIMTSDAYARSSRDDAHDEAIDIDNVNLWRFDRRRLTAEEIRDAMLFVSSDLDESPGGPHPFPAANTWSFTQHNPFTAVYDTKRRSVYLMVQRIKRHPFLVLFDGADPNSCTGRRDSTTVPTQALFVMNDPFVHERASSLASSLAKLPDDNARIDRAWRLLYGRPPEPSEVSIARKFLGAPAPGLQGWMRVMLSSNEFMYVN